MLLDGFSDAEALFCLRQEVVDRVKDDDDHAFQRLVPQSTVQALNGSLSPVLKEVVSYLLQFFISLRFNVGQMRAQHLFLNVLNF